MQFPEALDDAVAWLGHHAPRGFAAEILVPGTENGPSGIGVAPWRLTDSRVARGQTVTVLNATAHVGVWIWAAAPREAAAALQALFFAAAIDPDWRLSEREPPESFWLKPPLLSLALRHTVTLEIPTGPTRPVTQPLVLGVDTTPSSPARTRN